MNSTCFKHCSTHIVSFKVYNSQVIYVGIILSCFYHGLEWVRGEKERERILEITVLAQDEAVSSQDDLSANQNSDNFHVPENTLFDQKLSISCQPIPKRQANSVPSHNNKVDYVPQMISFLFLILYSSSYKASCLPCPFCMEDFLLYELLNKICLCPLNCLL